MFADTQEIKKIIQNPMILVPVLDETCAKYMPDVLKSPDSDLAILRDQIHIFMCLRHMVTHFKWRGGTENTKEFPISVEEREVYKWQEGMSIPMDATKQYVLANKKDIKKMVPCYVVLDPEFFILVSPDFENKLDNMIKIEFKKSL